MCSKCVDFVDCLKMPSLIWQNAAQHRYVSVALQAEGGWLSKHAVFLVIKTGVILKLIYQGGECPFGNYSF